MSETAHEAHGDLERLKKRFLTVKDLADKLNVSQKTIYSYVSQDLLPYVKIESNVRFDPHAISEWLNAKLSAQSGSKGARRAGTTATRKTSRATEPTERDFDVLRSFTIRRYLSASQVQGLFFPSIRTSNRRLQFLLRKGYLGRFSLAMKRDQGTSEFVYYLKRAGYEVLSIDPPAHVSSNPKPGRGSGPKSLAYVDLTGFFCTR